MPRLAALVERFGDRGFEIVSVALDDDREAVRAMAADRNLTWTQICDERGFEGPLPKTFNAQGFPVYYVIGADGNLLAKKIPLDEIEALLEATFAG